MLLVKSSLDRSLMRLCLDARLFHLLRLFKLHAQSSQGFVLVLMLAALSPSHHDDTAWFMNEPDRAIGRVDTLPTMPSAAKDLYFALGE